MYQTTITVSTKSRSEFIDVTSEIQRVVRQSEVQSGICYIYNPHTTAGLTINEHADPSVKQDIITKLDDLVPWRDNYRHAEGNAAAHIKASMMGSNLNILVENGKLVLGTWQGVFFTEFDGPRRRKLMIKITSD